ncbi:hypothetical protein RE474_02590 [Methanolobus sediminis]|uniref:PH domain-containing protein n=1 Tax=Methanolobus sediminis TaxID=3072978 RepID=A0AA51UL86_9EURY|nr:hypothetical protein [Methanolobus sediminis]WMW25629.1 hypothetical protein RE474_02590 [Methanolobus sediminis]
MRYVVLALVLLFAYMLPTTNFEPMTFAVMVIVVLIILSFSSLNVTIDQKYLGIKFGYGIFRKKFSLNEIVSARTVKNHWYYGWGIRLWLWPKMWIFNVSGFDAVEIKMKNGKIYRIGTDEPEKLESAILGAIDLKTVEAEFQASTK